MDKFGLKKIFLYALLIFAMGYAFHSTRFSLQELKLLSVLDFVFLSIMSLGLCLISAESLRCQLSIFALEIPFPQAFYISQFYSLLNYLPFKAGVIGEGLQLKTRYGFSLVAYVASTALVYFLNVSLYVIIGILLFIFYDFSAVSSYIKPEYLFGLIAVIAIAFGIYFLLPKSGWSNRYLRYLNTLVEYRSQIVQEKKRVFYFTAVLFIGLIIFSLRINLLLQTLHYPSSFAIAMMMSILASFSFLFSFTPAGIGVRESFMAALTFILFRDAAIGVVISLIIRVVDLFWLSILAAFSFYKLKKEKFL